MLSIAYADPYHHGYHNNYYNGWRYDWVAPAIIGGIITYELTRPQVVQQPTVIQTYPPTPYGYHYENILDANCRCYRLVLVQN